MNLKRKTNYVYIYALHISKVLKFFKFVNWKFFFIYKYDAITFIVISIKDCFIEIIDILFSHL